MSARDPADAAGWAVVDATVARAEDLLDGDLAAAFAIGSLAHGGFAAAASDVDVALLTAGDATIETVAATLAQDIARTNGDLGARLSVFHAPRRQLAAPPASARFPAIDRLDLLDSGVLVSGDDVRNQAARPGRSEVLDEAVAFTAGRLSVQQLVDLLEGARGRCADVRNTTKLILAPVRLAVLVREGRVLGNADAAVRYEGAHGNLVQAAVAWRASGRLPDGATLSRLLYDELLPLHLEQLAWVRAYPDVPDAGRLDDLLAELSEAQPRAA